MLELLSAKTHKVNYIMTVRIKVQKPIEIFPLFNEDIGRAGVGSVNSFGLQIIIKMDQNSKRKATIFESVSFYICTGLGSLMIIRNLIKMHRYSTAFQLAIGSLNKYHNNIDWIDNVKNKGMRETVFLQMVFVNIPKNYFKNIEDRSKYSTDKAKFYENLQCQSDLQGNIRFKGKNYPIAIKMNSPSIGFQLASNARIFDAKNIYLHRNQTISVFGEMHYSNKKQIVMRTQLMGLDSIEIIKYYQLLMIANVISTFYYAIILGIGVSIGVGLEGLAEDESWAKTKDEAMAK